MTQTVYDYGVFTPLIYGDSVVIDTSCITKESINDFQNDLKDVFLDYIENPVIQNAKVIFVFDNGMSARLTPSYALINIIVWGFIVNTGQKIKAKHLFFNRKGITNGYINS